jgi:PAS domain S-box-containing protein
MNHEAPQFRPIDRSQHKLLIVDDDPISRYATARLLRSAGFRTAEAANAAEGLAAAVEADVSAMVVDVHLPDIDGFEMCRILRSREHTHRMPVLHLSAAYVTDEDKVRGLDSGADAYLTHPVEPAVLVATVQALVRTRLAEEAMRRSESKFRAIYEQAPSGLALIDGDGRVRDANPQMLHLLGRRLDEVVGRRLDEFQRAAHPDDDPAEAAFDTPDGRSVHLSLSPPAQIEPGVSLIVATDVSQRAALETQRQQLLERERIARSEAERVSRLKDTFIAVLSHELRSPLNAMVGWTHVLQQRGGSDETMRALAAIERNGRLQARMISDLLDMSRLNLGKLPLSLDRVDPAEAVAAAVSAVQPDLDSKQIELRIEAVEPVGTLRADSSRLQQVIWNLLSNAVKFSPKGGRVTVGLRSGDGELVLSVSDQGQGIAPDFLPYVFDRFMQSDAGRNRQHGGLGLGLSIVKQLVEAHGGRVQVRSAGLGQGATFEVRLPLEGEAAQGGPAPTVADPPDSLLSSLDSAAEGSRADAFSGSASHERDAAESPLAELRLLVVDDDADASGMLQIILRDRGAVVRVAGSSALALAALREATFDVLISDIGMPGKDGYDLVRELRGLEQQTGRHLPAIALTSFTRGQDEAHALAAGFDAHCPKPLRPLNLVSLVARLAGR